MGNKMSSTVGILLFLALSVGCNDTRDQASTNDKSHWEGQTVVNDNCSDPSSPISSTTSSEQLRQDLFRRGMCNDDFEGVKEILEILAQRGDADAMVSLAVALRNEDHERSIRLLRQAAAKGNFRAKGALERIEKGGSI